MDHFPDLFCMLGDGVIKVADYWHVEEGWSSQCF